MTGGGQYYIVLDGELCYAQSALEKWSCMFVTPPESSPKVTAGSEGAEALMRAASAQHTAIDNYLSMKDQPEDAEIEIRYEYPSGSWTAPPGFRPVMGAP